MYPSGGVSRNYTGVVMVLATVVLGQRTAVAAPRFDIAAGLAYGEQAASIGDPAGPAAHSGFHVAAGLLFPLWESFDQRVRLELGPRLSFSWYGMEGWNDSATNRFWGWTGLVDAALELRLSVAPLPSKAVWVAPAIGAGIGSFFYSFDQVQYRHHCNPHAGLPAFALHADLALRWAFTQDGGLFVAPGITVMRVPFGETEAIFACGDTNHDDEFTYFGLAGPHLSFSVDLGWQIHF